MKKIILGAGIALLGTAAQLHAAGVASGTTITNSVTLEYSVGGASQTALTDTIDFTVDAFVATQATEVGATKNVVPGSVQQYLSYTITNGGNETFDIEVLAADSISGTSTTNGDSDDANTGASFTYYLDDGDGVFNTPADTQLVGGVIDDLVADDFVVIHVVADTIDSGLTSGQIAALDISATARLATDGSALPDQSGVAWDQSSKQYVFTDGTATATFTGLSQFDIVAPNLALTKTMTVVSDPLSSTNPKAIPGAVVEYTITLDNSSGTVDVTLGDITDVVALAELDSFSAVSQPGSVTPTTANDGTDLTITWLYSATPFTIAAGATETIVYRLVVQ